MPYLAQDTEKILKDRATDFQFFSLACDETMDITNTAQLAVFVPGITAEFDTRQELLSLEAMHGTTRGDQPSSKSHEGPIQSHLIRTKNSLYHLEKDRPEAERQFGPKGKEEVKTIEHQTQSFRLMPHLATTLALTFTSRHAGVLLDEAVFQGTELVDSRPRQALVAGPKAYSTRENLRCLQDGRECTGGMKRHDTWGLFFQAGHQPGTRQAPWELLGTLRAGALVPFLSRPCSPQHKAVGRDAGIC
uniref:Acyl-CoA oxidase C-alpha1 domain-containing protein n=1 Tax=Molossus molossus TaxID=27622 RepID=A0A7J8E023_MOLMO|nr:hypothetical protein HJG59_000214 [Molossus molossus]